MAMRMSHGATRQFLRNAGHSTHGMRYSGYWYSIGYRNASSQSETSSQSRIPMDSIRNPAAPRSKSTQSLRTVITVLSFFLVGSLSGTLVGGILVPPPLPILDSEDDAALSAKVKKDAFALDIVKELRSPESKTDGWIEYEAYMGMSEEIRDHNMSAGALRGTRGIGLRRMWWNGKKKELVGVMFLGGGVAGWPGVVHGGTLATICLDAIGTVGNGGPLEIKGPMLATTTQMDEMVQEFRIRYLKPTNANRLFLIRAKLQDDSEIIECWLEDALSGKTTIKATGKVGGPKVIVLGSNDVALGSGTIFGRLTKSLFG